MRGHNERPPGGISLTLHAGKQSEGIVTRQHLPRPSASPKPAQHDNPQQGPSEGNSKSPSRTSPQHSSPRKAESTARAIKQHVKEQALKDAQQDMHHDQAAGNGPANATSNPRGALSSDAGVATQQKKGGSSTAAGSLKGPAEPASHAGKARSSKVADAPMATAAAAQGTDAHASASSGPLHVDLGSNQKKGGKKSAGRGKRAAGITDMPDLGTSDVELLEPPAGRTAEPAVLPSELPPQPSTAAAVPHHQEQRKPSAGRAFRGSHDVPEQASAAAASDPAHKQDLSGNTLAPTSSQEAFANGDERQGSGAPASTEPGPCLSNATATANGSHMSGGPSAVPVIKPRSRKRPPVKDVHRHEVTEAALSAGGGKKGRPPKGKPSGAAGRHASKQSAEPGPAAGGLTHHKAPSSAAEANHAGTADASGGSRPVVATSGSHDASLANGAHTQPGKVSGQHLLAATSAQQALPDGPTAASSALGQPSKLGQQPASMEVAPNLPAQASQPLPAAAAQVSDGHKPPAVVPPSSAPPEGTLPTSSHPAAAASEGTFASAGASNAHPGETWILTAMVMSCPCA